MMKTFSQKLTRFACELCKPMVVLLVDDNDDDRMLFREACDGMNLELVEAGSGQEGLDILSQREDISLVICDAKMPGVCGADVYREMRQKGDRREVVFWTGHAGQLANRLRNSSCARVICKPHKINRPFVHDMLSQFGVRERVGEAVAA